MYALIALEQLECIRKLCKYEHIVLKDNLFTVMYRVGIFQTCIMKNYMVKIYLF